MSIAPEPAPGEAPRVGYLGPEGTFSEEALLAAAPAPTVQPVALQSIYDAVLAVREGDVEWAIVPIENSLDGSVTVTLDLLADDEMEVQIVGETLLRVRHSLISAVPIDLGEIDTVMTHPQVPGQCARLLRGELAHAAVLPASSTAEAVRSVVQDGRPRTAALGTVLAAEIYGGTVLREGVEDHDDNETRFVWLARRGLSRALPELRGAGETWNTSVLFWGSGTDHSGWLVRCLDEFALREVNLTKIESRPRRGRIGSYMFFADLSGRAADEHLAAGIAGLRERATEVRVLGSYRAAQHD
jgi:prephenate dehydratase